MSTAQKKWTPPTTERDARVELAAAYRMAYDQDWTDLGATHFSLAVPGEDAETAEASEEVEI